MLALWGKGVALEFKKRWPENFKQYKKLCDAKNLVPGKMFIFDTGDLLSNIKPRYLINFPTKNHWRSKSKLSYIKDGLDDFIKQIKQYNIKSVALPPLGCGNGGLPWEEDVKPLIEEKLASVTDVEFIIYAPKTQQQKPEYADIPEGMTFERAMMVKAIGQLEQYFSGYLTKISLQKTVYFLQTLGINYNLEFSRNKHGPYSKKLSTAFKAMEAQNYISGYSLEEPEIRATQAAFSAAEDFLNGSDFQSYQQTITKLGLLIEGFESPHGMELLSSVHYLVDHENNNNIDDVIKAFKNWNDHKSNGFSDTSIKDAFNRLKTDKLILVN